MHRNRKRRGTRNKLAAETVSLQWQSLDKVDVMYVCVIVEGRGKDTQDFRSFGLCIYFFRFTS